jgi:hypothetical protein
LSAWASELPILPAEGLFVKERQAKKMGKRKIEKDLLEKLKKDHPRLDFYGLHYYKICSDACTLVKEFRSEAEKIRERMPKPVKNDGMVKLYRLGPRGRLLLDEIRKQESVTIAFAAMCLEALIWDYAACRTSQNKAEENFGSLNLVAKWVVIPQILCHTDITKARIGSTCLLHRLRKLKDARNDMVHPKSKPLPGNLRDALKRLYPQRPISAEDAFGLIKPLLGELKKVDKTNWWFFKSDAYREIIKR